MQEPAQPEGEEEEVGLGQMADLVGVCVERGALVGIRTQVDHCPRSHKQQQPSISS